VVETRVPEFNGRLQTWRDVTLRGQPQNPPDNSDNNDSLFEIMTRETQNIAQSFDTTQVVPGKEITMPLSLTVITACALALYMWLGNSPWQLAAQHLWAGDLFAATTPRITITPGDTVVARGTNVIIEATLNGFLAEHMEVVAAFESTDGWETAPMTRLAENKYSFVFVAVTEQVAFYTTAAGLNSKRYLIRVADLPRVTEVKLRLQHPPWTGLKESDATYGDIRALSGTKINVSAVTDIPVTDPLFVVNGQVLRASTVKLETQGTFEIDESGNWYVATRIEGTLARISDTFEIDVMKDEAPEVSFSWPGHDSQATSIEEVAMRFRASDDIGVKSLALHYSVNGGAWVEVPLDSTKVENEHLLYLEDLNVVYPITPAIESTGQENQRALRPGDMISFYGDVSDHQQQSRTAIYFIDIRPFDRTYRESQQNASGSGGGGNPGLEIARRQREIVSATWNLINKRNSRNQGVQAGDPDSRDATTDTKENDRADVLAMLQRTLKDQVLTLTGRADARQLNFDDEIDVYTTELGLAADYMEPAALELETGALNQAIAPLQQALQHLLAAAASVRDVDVSRSTTSGRGTASQSLSELIDLEMDPERNRYETPQKPGAENDTKQNNSDWEQLEELATRQQQLAARQREEQESVASRWQQERLQRELNALRERLENRLQNQSSQGQSSEQSSISRAIAELNQANDAIERASEQSEGNPASTQQAMDALRRAASQLRAGEHVVVDQRLAQTARQVDNLLADQQAAMDRLDRLEQEIMQKSRQGERAAFNDYQMQPYAAQKRRMQKDLNNIAREISELGNLVSSRDPDTELILKRALAKLTKDRIDEHLVAVAEAFDNGRPLFAISSETVIESALQRLGASIDDARLQLASSGAQPQDNTNLARVRGLRQALDSAQQAAGIGTNISQANSLLQAANALEQRLGIELGESFKRNTARGRANYAPRGTNDENVAALIRLAKDRLDLIEARLLSMKTPPVRAQKVRDSARDSAQAARYFRDLSAQP
jgi:hypothetical protein